jgi:hypothetical protein
MEADNEGEKEGESKTDRAREKWLINFQRFIAINHLSAYLKSVTQITLCTLLCLHAMDSYFAKFGSDHSVGAR